MSNTPIKRDDWITRADAAALARCSEDSIRGDISKHDLATQADDQGRVTVGVADLIRIGRIRAEDLATGMTATESAEVLRARETVTALREQVAESTGRLTHATRWCRR